MNRGLRQLVLDDVSCGLDDHDTDDGDRTGRDEAATQSLQGGDQGIRVDHGGGISVVGRRGVNELHLDRSLLASHSGVLSW